MADIRDRYPLATADGVAIPNDTIRPVGVSSLGISGTAVSATGFPTRVNTVVLFASADCIIRFGATAISASTTLQDNALFLPKGTLMTVSPPVMTSISVIGAGAATGDLYITVVEPWAGLALELQTTRR